MPEFAFTARNANGEDIVGSVSASGKREALSILSNRGLFPSRVESTKTQKLPLNIGLPLRRRVGAEALAAALTQLGDLLENGVALLASLKILAEQSPHAVLREVMQDVHDQVAEGVSLDEALARHPRVFSELAISMVRAGMEGAFLEDALRRVAGFLERQEELKSRVMGAMAYPVFLAVIGSIVTTVLVVVFVPKFEPLFERLQRSGNGLPMATTMLLFLSDFLSKYGIFVLLAAVVGLWLARTQLASPEARRWLDGVKLKLPLAGKIFHNSAISRFCRVLGTLLRNGVPILKALQISSASSGNRLLAEAIVQSAENVSSGESLSRPLADSGLVPPAVMAMISVAEEANTLDNVLINVADRIDQRIERQLSLMVKLVEPVMLVLIGGIVMFVLVALLLPIIEASTTVG